MVSSCNLYKRRQKLKVCLLKFVKRNTMPKTIFCLFSLLALFSCSSVKYYVVRHAEKETASAGTTMSAPNDPPLSAAGKVRAIELREALKNKGIQYIY